MAHLEDSERDLVPFYDVVWVMVGPVYEREVPDLPMADEEHTVPSGFWKIVITEAHGEGLKVAGFVMDQETPSDAKLVDQLRTVRHIETITGLDFFRQLEDAAELEDRLDAEWVEVDFPE